MANAREGNRTARRLGRERIPVVIVDGYDEMAKVAADRIAEIIREKEAAGGHAVLGLATGSTPIGIYRELIRMHREEGLSFRNVVTFNLDEYFPMKPESIQSFQRFMWENFFNEIDIPRENVHLLLGDRTGKRRSPRAARRPLDRCAEAHP